MEENNVRPNAGNISEQEIAEELSKMNLPSNSHKENKRIKRTIQGKAVSREKTLGEKFGETFLADDLRNVGTYILFDVLVPTLKDAVVNVVVNGITALVYPNAQPRNQRFGSGYSYGSSPRYSSSYGQQQHTPYSSISSGKRNQEQTSYGYSPAYSKEPIVETRYDADIVLEELNECLCEYDQVTVGDLYDILRYDTKNTDYQWGWVDLSTATVRKVRGGWLIDLPRPTRL